MGAHHLRDFETVQSDSLWMVKTPWPQDDVRHKAVAEVLCSLPEDDYDQLKGLEGTFQWFIPYDLCDGGVFPFLPSHPDWSRTPGPRPARLLDHQLSAQPASRYEFHLRVSHARLSTRGLERQCRQRQWVSQVLALHWPKVGELS